MTTETQMEREYIKGGAFLIEAFDQLHAAYEASNDRLQELRGHRSLFDLDRRILEHNLYGVDLSPHRSQLITAELVQWAELVLVMDARQRQVICDRFGRAPRDIVILGDLDRGPVSSRGIEDPVEQSVEVCQRAYDRIERCLAELVNVLWGTLATGRK